MPPTIWAKPEANLSDHLEEPHVNQRTIAGAIVDSPGLSGSRRNGVAAQMVTPLMDATTATRVQAVFDVLCRAQRYAIVVVGARVVAWFYCITCKLAEARSTGPLHG
jgi:hypothetical protein